MDSMSINYWAVLVAALAYWALGALWYSPVLFGKAWLKATGKSKEQWESESSPINFLWAFVASFIASYGIARLMLWIGGSTIFDGITIAVLAGICFVLTSFLVNDAFENRPKLLTIINILYHMVGLIIAGVIIGAWR